jgi:tetratricopeptide (TPR) repeat protein
MFKPKLLALYLVLTIAGMHAHAGPPDNWNDGEVELAGAYCMDTMGFRYGDAYGNTSPRASYWVAQMGKGFWNMHHYCWAMISLRRGKSMPLARRQASFESARGDLIYVVHNSPADFVMLPEVLSRLGEVDVLLGNLGAAHTWYEQARTLRPDYPQAYAEWAEVLIRLKKQPDALNLVRQGLKYSPGSSSLMAIYKRLGGKPADLPKAEAKPASAAGQATAPESAASAASSASTASAGN